MPKTRALIVAAARSGFLRDLGHPRPTRDLIHRAATRPATREMANLGLLFLPVRFVPLGWLAKWATPRALRRLVNTPVGRHLPDESGRAR